VTFLAVAWATVGFAGCVDLTRPWNNAAVDGRPPSTAGNDQQEAAPASLGGTSNPGLGGTSALGGRTGTSSVGGGTGLGGAGEGGTPASGGANDAALDVASTNMGGDPVGLGGSSGDGGKALGGTRNGGALSTGGTARNGGAVAGGAVASAGGTSAVADASSPAQGGSALSGPVVRYACDQSNGPKLLDTSGNLYNGTLIDTPPDGGTATPGYSFGAGKVGSGALILTSTSDGYVAMPANILTGATEMTIATWVYVTTVQSFQRIFDIGINAHSKTNPPADGSNAVYMNLIPSGAKSDRKLAFAISKTSLAGEQKVAATSTFPTALWTHVAVVLGGGTGTLYINGAAAASSAITLRPSDLGPVDYAFIGKSQFADPYLNGQIDDFRVYTRALSANEIQSLYSTP